MKNLIKSLLVAASLASAGLAVSAPAASATEFQVIIGPSNNGVPMYDSRDNRGWGNGYHDGWGRRDYGRDHRRASACSPREAMFKARDIGIRAARIVDISDRKIVVSGFKRGYPVRAIFANRWNCPVVALR